MTGSTGLASGSRTYQYDLDGNRVRKVEGGVTYDMTFKRTDQQVQVTTNGGGAYTVFNYDEYGNLTSNAESVSSVKAMTYDKADKLTSINAGGTPNDATFTFDALGRFRTRALAGGTTTDTYSYAGTSETVLRITNSSGPTVTDSIISPAGDRLGIKQGTTVNWLLPDLHGNVGASLDSSEATVVNATRYDAYGQTLSTGTAGGTAVGQANWKFQGRLDVSPVGLASPLYDMSARFYSPGLGTFTQLDAVTGGAQNPLSMNRFLYALGNPATLIDPTGHLACSAYNEDCLYQQAGLQKVAAVSHKKWLAAKATKGRTSERDVENRSNRHRGQTNWQVAAAKQFRIEQVAAAKGFRSKDWHNQEIRQITEDYTAAQEAASGSACQMFCDIDVGQVIGVTALVVGGALVCLAACPALAAGAVALASVGSVGVTAAATSACIQACGALIVVGTFGVEASCSCDASSANPPSFSRPSGYRAGVRDSVWKAAIELSTGRVRDPLTGKFIGAGQSWDMGHKPGFEFRSHQRSAASRGVSRPQFLDEHNNPSHYRPELPASNQGHSLEETTGEWRGAGD